MKTSEALNTLRHRSILSHIPTWSNNMGRNVIWADRCATTVPVHWKKTVVIFASGASLSLYEKDLHKLNGKVTVVATPTNVAWLQSKGVRIDLVVVMDSHPIMGKMLEDYSGLVIAPTTVDVSVSAHKAHFYKMKIAGLDLWNVIQDTMFTHLSLSYPAELGCVTNMAFALCCDIPKDHRIVLAGADYSYWRGKARIAEKLEKAPKDAITWDGKQTSPSMVMYKDALLKLWARTIGRTPVYSMSHGIVTEIPHVALGHILEENWPELHSKETVVELSEKHIEQFKNFGEVVSA